MTMPGRLATAALLALALVAAACSARRGEPVVGPTWLSAQGTRGEKVFMANCHQCHPKGEPGLGPGINDKPLPGFLIRFQVRNGLGAMPSFSRDHISETELDDLIAYLRELRGSG